MKHDERPIQLYAVVVVIYYSDDDEPATDIRCLRNSEEKAKREAEEFEKLWERADTDPTFQFCSCKVAELNIYPQQIRRADRMDEELKELARGEPSEAGDGDE